LNYRVSGAVMAFDKHTRVTIPQPRYRLTFFLPSTRWGLPEVTGFPREIRIREGFLTVTEIGGFRKHEVKESFSFPSPSPAGKGVRKSCC
jgi:hypothetical protein